MRSIPEYNSTNANSGHGHVYPRPDGVRARCGGPAICSVCAKDFAIKSYKTNLPAMLESDYKKDEDAQINNALKLMNNRIGVYEKLIIIDFLRALNTDGNRAWVLKGLADAMERSNEQ